MENSHEKHCLDICRRSHPVCLPNHCAERMHTQRHPAAERVTPSLVAIPSGIARIRRRRHRYTTVYRAAGRQRIEYPNGAQQRPFALGFRRAKKPPRHQVPAGHLPRQTHCDADTSIVLIRTDWRQLVSPRKQPALFATLRRPKVQAACIRPHLSLKCAAFLQYL